jgi:hypothetical protein
MGYPRGIQLRDTLTQRAAINNGLEIRNTSLQSLSANLLTLSSSPSTGNIAGFNVVDWFDGAVPYTATGNTGSTARQPSAIGLPSEVFNLDTTNNPVPSPSSEPATAGTSYGGRLTGDNWYTNVSYRGAFDPSLPRNQQWDWGWANYDPQNTDYSNGVPTAVEDVSGPLPESFDLGQNYPNPFNPTTVIRFSVPKSVMVELDVYNVLGQKVATVVNEHVQAGTHEASFDGSGLPSGVYFYRLVAGGSVETKKMVLMK